MNLLNLFAKITLDKSEYDKGINDASKKMKSFSSTVGSALLNGAKAVAKFSAAVTAISGVVVGLSAKVISSTDEID